MTTNDNVVNFLGIYIFCSACLSYRVSVIGMNKYSYLLKLECTMRKLQNDIVCSSLKISIFYMDLSTKN